MLTFIHDARLSCQSYSLLPDYLFNYDISSDARILYSKIIRRAMLSICNCDYTDADGNAFVIFSVAEVQSLFHCGEHKACKIFRELEQSGLILRKKPGQGKHSLIYPYIESDSFCAEEFRTVETAIQELSESQSSYKDINYTEEYNNKYSIKSNNMPDVNENDSDILMAICQEQIKDSINYYQDYYGDHLIIPSGNKKHKISATQLPEMLNLVNDELINRVAKRIVLKTKKDGILPKKSYIHNALLMELLRVFTKSPKEDSISTQDKDTTYIKQLCGYESACSLYPLLRPYMDYIASGMASIFKMDNEAIIHCFGIPVSAGELKLDFANTNLVKEAIFVRQNGFWEGMQDNFEPYSQWSSRHGNPYKKQEIKDASGYQDAISRAPQYKNAINTMMSSMMVVMNMQDTDELKINGGPVSVREVKQEFSKIDSYMLEEAADRYYSLRNVVTHPVAYFIRLLYSVASEYETRFENLIHSGREGVDYIRTRKRILSA